MEKRFLYFAYGSNMDKEQMKLRCPDAICKGTAVLPDYKLTERRYADIDESEGGAVSGLLWSISEADLKALDRYEGWPNLYERKRVLVWHNYQRCNKSVMRPALVYIMTPETKAERHGQKYNEYYRDLCSRAAQAAGIKDEFNQ
jgi:gamma-glutamylcyclotransferase (GGCT)/AIG2-like uncharacterized protein YtfP